ncbi:hypothetical protein F2Q69_00042556 [Brassica cretica]|uniref:Uncharacterized protein n=1 Tax=Brassica cretica TaxID=69181 RepID=A0A8S9NT22_BRACR|nr:hypothetical protein F2Q69_00042556 [Brassica cretica]
MPPPEKLVSRWRLGLEFDLARKRRRTETHQPENFAAARLEATTTSGSLGHYGGAEHDNNHGLESARVHEVRLMTNSTETKPLPSRAQR